MEELREFQKYLREAADIIDEVIESESKTKEEQEEIMDRFTLALIKFQRAAGKL